jgi:hypothetical protein
MPRARTGTEAPLHGDGRQPAAKERAALGAGRVVAGHEQYRTAPRAAERRVDSGLADERPVESQVLVVLARDGVVDHAGARPGHRVHPDQ